MQLEFNLKTFAADVDLQKGITRFDHFRVIFVCLFTDPADGGSEDHIPRTSGQGNVQGQNLQVGVLRLGLVNQFLRVCVCRQF